MDELVVDLTLALERTDDPQSSNSDATIGRKDSPSSTPVRKAIKKRRGRKRRSDFPLTKDLSMLSEGSNDSIDEALKDYIENITMMQSDSDEDSAFANSKRLSMLYRYQMMEPYPLPERPESDSFAENAGGRRRSKRNKKLKRTPQSLNYTGVQFQSSPELSSQYNHHGNIKISHGHTKSLKRKHSCKLSSAERQSMCDDGGQVYYYDTGRHSSSTSEPMEVGSFPRHGKHFKILGADHGSADYMGESGAIWLPGRHNKDDMMLNLGSDSDASSDVESEGFFTNDEGRLADDEQEESSYEHEIPLDPWWEQDCKEMEEDEKFNNILNGVMDEYGIPETNGTRSFGFQARLNMMSMYGKDNLKPMLIEANKKISKFIQDSSKTELYLPLNSRAEQHQIRKLASLYSLHCLTENSTRDQVVLIKTKNTSRPDKIAINRLFGKQRKNRKKVSPSSKVKKARKTLPASEVAVAQATLPIPEHNIGNQMLREMGWVPGKGLGPNQSGRVDPVKATMRPKGLGLGHTWPSSK
ncbi:predicted protein [Nematostella vectensis]|uniref:G-patch domain-containing protein n=1 Tax=Nematostella vectensis TaxID=45351 RepID=A7RHK5_NEMVE|nr:predicted protein [Nematostella vectensis]|eukprot:XP_001640932.1 predicted protein [Nematostella vectensis]